jgi:hypothetical protein
VAADARSSRQYSARRRVDGGEEGGGHHVGISRLPRARAPADGLKSSVSWLDTTSGMATSVRSVGSDVELRTLGAVPAIDVLARRSYGDLVAVAT